MGLGNTTLTLQGFIYLFLARKEIKALNMRLLIENADSLLSGQKSVHYGCKSTWGQF